MLNPHARVWEKMKKKNESFIVAFGSDIEKMKWFLFRACVRVHGNEKHIFCRCEKFMVLLPTFGTIQKKTHIQTETGVFSRFVLKVGNR